ncbi:TonB-dependent receptor [Terrarubrum flagellatum]|uniref:TonB-dependent receptor n=1 Tax=Terrirubrum flagellatum TaxID=2895980 RepID=UPI0031453855
MKEILRWALAGCALAGLLSAARAQGETLEITVTADSPIAAPRSTAPASPGALTVIDRAFAPVTFLTQREIITNGGRTLGDQLSALPGVSNSGFAPGAANRPIIRGLDNFRVRIQENGIGSQDVSDLGEDHGVPIDPLAAQRIEIIRGPATLRYGSQAIGGVVSAENNRIPDALIDPGFHAVTRGGVSSVDKGYEASTLMDARSGDFVAHADIYKRSASDYRIPGGTQLNSFVRSEGQSLGGSWFFPGGYVGAAISHFTSLYGIPGADAPTNRTRIDLEQTKITSKGEYRIDAGGVDALRFWIGGSFYKHREENINDAGGFDTGAIFRNREIEARVESQFKAIDTPLGRWVSALGVQAGRQSIGTAGDAGSLLAPATTTTLAAYAFGELSLLPATRLQTALRLEHARVGGTAAIFPADLLGASGDPVDDPRTRRFTPFSASLGLQQDIPFGFTASLTGQYVERAPRAPELFSRGAHDAPGTFEIGDPNLKKETAKTIELGLRRAAGPWRFDGTIYHTRYDGFIYKRATGVRCGDDFASCGIEDDFQQIVYSQRNATFTGAEARTQYDLREIGGGFVGVEGQYDIVRARFTDGGNVPRIPPQRFGGGAYFRSETWFARVSLLHAYAQNRPGENDTPTPGYNLLNAEINYTTSLRQAGLPKGAELTIGVSGTNLLNETIRNATSFRKDDVVMPGRGGRLFVSVKF